MFYVTLLLVGWSGRWKECYNNDMFLKRGSDYSLTGTLLSVCRGRMFGMWVLESGFPTSYSGDLGRGYQLMSLLFSHLQTEDEG